MSRHPRNPMHRLPLRFLTATSVAGLTLLAAPTLPAQIYEGTTEATDAPEPRFGMFRDPSGYEGSEVRDPVDYNGELLEAKDGELTLSLWKGVNGSEALEVATEGDYPADEVEANLPADGLGDDLPEPVRVAVRDGADVYLNGRRAKLSDLRPGDRIRVRAVDADGTDVQKIVALRTDDIRMDDGLQIHPDPEIDDPASLAPADGDEDDAPSPEIARAAETGVTTPGGGGFQDAPKTNATGKTRENLENPDRGVVVDPNRAPQSAMAGAGSPGFGFAIADSPGEGVLVVELQPGGPADEAGLRDGDFLTQLAGRSLTVPTDVKAVADRALSGEEPQTVSGVAWRDGKELQFEITPSPDARDYYGSSAGAAFSEDDLNVSPTLGARVRNSDGTGVEVVAGYPANAGAGVAPRTTGYAPGGYAPGGVAPGGYVPGAGLYPGVLPGTPNGGNGNGGNGNGGNGNGDNGTGNNGTGTMTPGATDSSPGLANDDSVTPAGSLSNTGQTIDTTGADANVPGVSGTNATGTNKTGTNNTGTNATGTNATGTNATGTNATGTNATGTNATGTNATGTNATGT
ncbi:PDZ domain-containing protein, partial [Alienimonas sp. DA493]|uniref:PDZ domain-containing protein n=1 Tax=Alienimonas sp. DA493 TaxID=3373605 RepID=UPI003754D9A0